MYLILFLIIDIYLQRVVRDLGNQLHQNGDVDASENNEVRVGYEDNHEAANEAIESELTPLDDIEVGDEENRNKRLVGDSSGSGGSGGSGNFLFDIIRVSIFLKIIFKKYTYI